MSNFTVVMPVFNAARIVSRTLPYLIGSGVEPHRIIVGDDASTEQELEAVQSWSLHRGVCWDRVDANLGYTRNINRCLRRVDTEFVLLLNSDCFISLASIEALVGVLKKFDMLSCVGPLSSNAGHQTVTLKREIQWGALENEEIMLFSERISKLLEAEFGVRPWVMPSVNGFCCLWRTAVLRAIDFFDAEEFPRGYGEEDDACIRATELGLMPAIAPFVFAPHLKTQSFSIKERDSLKLNALNKLRMKFSVACVDRLVGHYSKSPQIAELRRIAVGGQDA